MNRLIYEFEGKPVEIRLTDKPVSLGRSDEADHKLPTKSASRIHAQVFLRDGAWWLEDLDSSNGTALNGTKVSKPTPLNNGDEFMVGDVKIKYEGKSGKSKGPPEHLIARLIYQPEQGKPPIELLLRERVTIGRKPDNSLQIDSKAVSGHHCEIVPREGACVVRDLGSSNGTFIGKQRVTKEHTLRNGEMLVLGQTISLYFIDPAASKFEEAAKPAAESAEPAAVEPNAPPPKPAPAKPTSAAGASDRGTFEPVRVKPKSDKAPGSGSPALAIAVGVGVAGLFVLMGWLAGSIIHTMRQPEQKTTSQHQSEAPLADVAFSFEGEIDDRGNPEGWTASFEAHPSITAELTADTFEPYDGKRSLSIATTGPGGSTTLVLQTQQARPIERAGSYQASLYVRGEGAARIAVAVSLIGERGEAVTIAAGSFVGIRGTAWARLDIDGVLLAEAPETAQVRLLINGSYSRLWVDRFELTPTGESIPGTPLDGLGATGLDVSLNAKLPVETRVSAGEGKTARFMPVLLNTQEEVISEPELWSVFGSNSRRIAYSALIPARGDAASVEFTAATRESAFFPAHGYEFYWRVTQGGADSLAISIELPMPRDATIVAADRRGVPLLLSRENIHTYAYSTISEIMVNDTDVAVGFPDGAVVWIDTSRPDTLRLTARAAVREGRKALRVSVFTLPAMFARMYDRLYRDALRMWGAEHGSAAKARLTYLVQPGRPHRELAVIGKARDKLIELNAAHAELYERMERAWITAEATRSPEAILDAERLMRTYRAMWPGEEAIRALPDRFARVAEWKAEIDARKRTPEEMAAAETTARGLYADADQSHKAGHFLLALVLLENVLRDYSDTSVFRQALSLYEEITETLRDPALHNDAINKELEGIDEDIRFRDFGRARDRCNALFRRFPDTPRNRDIMLRLRAIDRAFQD